MKDKIVLITGGTDGIGKQTASPKEQTMQNQKFRLEIFAIAASATTALNASIFLIATAGGASLGVKLLGESTSGIVNVLAGTLVSLMFAAAVLKLILNKRPGFAIPASWLGFGFAVISGALPLLAGNDLLTGASLASMHLVAGLGWIVGVRVANQSQTGSRRSQ